MLSTRFNKALIVLSFGVSITSALACRGPLPPPNSDEEADDQADDEPLPDLPPPDDLPCGGADLMNDNDNCGSCGNECGLGFGGTDWEAGTCDEGVCGPGWTTCYGNSGVASTCDQFCSGGGQTCVANGCSGLTALLFDVGVFDPCDIYPNGPDGTMTGPCDEQIPWMSDIETERRVMCCCGE